MKYKIGIKRNQIIPAGSMYLNGSGKWEEYYCHGEAQMGLHKNHIISYLRLSRPIAAESRKIEKYRAVAKA